jgi:hypothetical protein
MIRLISRRAGSLAGLLLDAMFVLTFLWPISVCDLTLEVSTVPGAPQSTGRVLWELARAQEAHRETHGTYARRVSDLGPRPGWDIVIVRASASSYAMRISNRTDTCAIWGSRAQPTRVEPFYMNCGSSSAPLGGSVRVGSRAT